MTDPAVRVDDVSKSFRVYRDRNQSLKATILQRRRAQFEVFEALKGVSLEVPEGTTFGLLGHNGSGKSTLLKVMARILRPTSGSITTRGRVAAMLEVGSGFHPELSGRENVYLNASILGMSRQEVDRKFDQIVDFSGVEAFIDQPVKNYSSGMYVRLGFAVSIHVEPEVLLVDEVLAVGDMEFQDKCLDKFAQFRDEGRTVVVVSHGVEQMKTFCDQVAWLDHGVLQDVGDATKIVEKYTDVSHEAEQVEGGGTRFGTGEVRIDRVELVTADGRVVEEARTGEAVRIRMHYEASESVERPIFGLSVATAGGKHVWSQDGRVSETVPDRIPAGFGHVDVTVDRLMLMPDLWDVSVSVTDFHKTRVIDSHQRAMRFAVLSGHEKASGGSIVLDARVLSPVVD
ncbi:ABC transporter ATP-binding protein [Agrococcus jejuensis]|uniref:ABC-2 type transport system ATP-binding protein n=1 Tax=Agrococcus jejuensis TaxID=399736 RepID=A0A1G8FI47_9MICO|nr:ABC transporter ATP-binding protein [Agrococcus jejuensis]SDH81833.1 ABC-2 type transport system ATP-binding protein [Agrococcus jejuensis]